PPGQKMNDRPPKSQRPTGGNAAIERRKTVKTPARQGTKATHWHSGRPTATTNRQAAKVNVGIRALITFITHRGSWTQPDFAQVWARSASLRPCFPGERISARCRSRSPKLTQLRQSRQLRPF